MKILMLALASSPEGHLREGKVYDLPKAEAEALLKPGPHGLPYARKIGKDDDEPVSQMSKPPAPAKDWHAEGE